MNNKMTLKTFIQKAVCPYQCIETCESMLSGAGFLPLSLTTQWKLEQGKSYYVNAYGTSLFSFYIPEISDFSKLNFRIASAHTDFPCFRIKPKAEMREQSYLKLDVEAYGGAVLASWLDRPLSIAGKIVLKSSDPFRPDIRLWDYQKPLLTIPGLAIHMNHQINKGVEYNKQTELLPLFGMLSENTEPEHYFLSFLAKNLNTKIEDILDFDLYVYNAEEPVYLGENREFFSSPRLDNQTSVFACLNGIQFCQDVANETKVKDFIPVIALYDNEEVGSRSKQGADSMLTNYILKKIWKGLSIPDADFEEGLFRSFLVSLDVAHAYHPNFPSKCDPCLKPQLSKGVILKYDSTQRYAYDVTAMSIIKQILTANQIPYQCFVNRSDVPGGSTLGAISSSWLPVPAVDMGVGLLSMHSCRELMGTADQDALNRFVEGYFTTY